MKKIVILSLLILTGLIILSGCSGDNQLTGDLIYSFAGSIGVGDFVEVELNMTEKTYQYDNLINGDAGQGTFTSVNQNLYQLDNGDQFVLLDNQILVVSVSEEEPGQRLIAALKKTDRPYGDEIRGTYNVATSLEGWVGYVTINPDPGDPTTGTIDVRLDTDGNYADFEEELDDLPYSFNQTYGAIEAVESDSFKHYGVFLNDEVAVWDSYEKSGDDWVGDGMFFLVKQDTVNLADYEGRYTYIDVDGDYGTFELVDNSGVLHLTVDGEDLTETLVDLGNGVFELTADLVEPVGKTEKWYFLFLPGKVIVVASSVDETFGGVGDGGGFAIGVKSE